MKSGKKSNYSQPFHIRGHRPTLNKPLQLKTIVLAKKY